MVPDHQLILAALAAGVILEWGWLRLVDRKTLLAQVNERSSHAVPTPTMGGLVIAVIVLVYLALLGGQGNGPAAAVAVGLFAVAAIGLWDDLSPRPAWTRLFTHVLAATVCLYALPLELAWWQWLIYGLGLVWLINLYNFMDGIDGLAGVQCFLFCMGLQLLSDGTLFWTNGLIWVLAAATLAFLTFNWPPARIFMGDVGSGFLGLALGFIALHAHATETLPLIVSLILLAGFWFDATYTLCVRMLTGQRITEAHRSHLYQRLTERYGHRWTTLAFAVFNVLWLWPLAAGAQYLSQNFPLWSISAPIIAVLPLAVLCWVLQAGRIRPDMQ